jgi:hypothetical protein
VDQKYCALEVTFKLWSVTSAAYASRLLPADESGNLAPRSYQLARIIRISKKPVQTLLSLWLPIKQWKSIPHQGLSLSMRELVWLVSIVITSSSGAPCWLYVIQKGRYVGQRAHMCSPFYNTDCPFREVAFRFWLHQADRPRFWPLSAQW